MKKIALILTGGTIGSKVTDHIIDVGEEAGYVLVDSYEKMYGEKDTFSVFSPFQSLSENFTRVQWQSLCDFLWDFPFGEYEGVVIAHGTDTLAYSAALVSMLFGRRGVPIVFVASNYPVGEPGSNGVRNLRGAVNFIQRERIPGVFAAYENDREEMEIHLGTRMIPADNVRDQYGSFGGPCFGVVKESGFVWNVCANNPSIESCKKMGKEGRIFREKIAFTKDVLFLMPYPGQNYESISLEQKPAAVYHYLYHAGTACVTEGKYSFLNFARRCNKEEIPLYVASLKKGNVDAYATGNAILQEHVIPMFDISPVAGYIKVLIAYNQKEKTAEEVMRENFFFET